MEGGTMSHQQLLSIGIIALGVAAAHTLWAQQAPTWGSGASGSPTAGSSTSNKANAAADSTMYQDIQYVNAAKRGPRLVVIPGEIKSNNASFMQRYAGNNIADWGELELSKANFQVLERAALGPLLT